MSYFFAQLLQLNYSSNLRPLNLQDLYAQDTFFHLSMLARVGLVTLSIALALATVFLFWKASQHLRLRVKIPLAIAFIWIFVWISPQAYYFYYILVIDGLPYQNVIQYPPTINEIITTITFSGKSNLSNHGKGLIFWALILIALKPTAKKLAD